MTVPGQKQPTDTPNLWAVPLLTLVVLLVPTLILVFSNTKSTTLNFAGLDWSAPLWLILLATFAAGIILGRLFGWLWGVFRRRRAKVKAEVGGAGGAAR
ncbi:MAG TPA: LapA family protein [Acidimicrobiia bacterium]|nr:LapA family protein [Acidimicrobiia bacterium]